MKEEICQHVWEMIKKILEQRVEEGTKIKEMNAFYFWDGMAQEIGCDLSLYDAEKDELTREYIQILGMYYEEGVSYSVKDEKQDDELEQYFIDFYNKNGEEQMYYETKKIAQEIYETIKKEVLPNKMINPNNELLVRIEEGD